MGEILENYSGKGKIGKIFHELGKVFENRGKSETGGMHHFLRGMDAPVCAQYKIHIGVLFWCERRSKASIRKFNKLIKYFCEP